MFNKNKRVELNSDEIRIILLSLTNFRNNLIKENEYADPINEVIPKVKRKMKVDKYDLGIIINGLNNNRKEMQKSNEDVSIINNLILRLIDISESFK